MYLNILRKIYILFNVTKWQSFLGRRMPQRLPKCFCLIVYSYEKSLGHYCLYTIFCAILFVIAINVIAGWRGEEV